MNKIDIQGRTAVVTGRPTQVLDLRVNQGKTDHDPGKQAGQAEDTGMTEDSQHPCILG